MKISELIKQLTQQMENNGDVKVVITDYSNPKSDTKSVSVIQPIRNEKNKPQVMIR